MTNDKGATFARGAVRALDRATIVSQWGWKRPHIRMVKVAGRLGEATAGLHLGPLGTAVASEPDRRPGPRRHFHRAGPCRHIHKPELDVIVPPMLKVSSLLDASPFLRADASPAALAAAAEASAASPQQLLLSFIGSIRPKNRGYSFGVRQQVFKLFNQVRRRSHVSALARALDAPTLRSLLV